MIDSQWRSAVTLCVGSAKDFCSTIYTCQYNFQMSTAMRILRGKNMRSTVALFNEFAAAWQFPCYFGNNWDAFEECMSDLEWVPSNSYLVAILDGADVLCNQPDKLALFLEIMTSLAKEWRRKRGLPFHTILHCADENIKTLRQAMTDPLDIVQVSELKGFISAWQSSARQS